MPSRSTSAALLNDLRRLKLWRAEAEAKPKGRGPGVLLSLCEQGALEGGLSVALDVRPDEAFGALCAAVGGSARGLRVVDVRVQPYEVLVALEGMQEAWDVPDLPALAHNLNDLFRNDSAAKAIALLGEWEDAHQLWCVPKSVLEALFRVPAFEPRNEDDLRSLIA